MQASNALNKADRDLDLVAATRAKHGAGEIPCA